jgi:hypothetical protein
VILLSYLNSSQIKDLSDTAWMLPLSTGCDSFFERVENGEEPLDERNL